VNRYLTLVIGLLLFSAAMSAQNPPSPVPTMRVSLVLPKGIPSETVQIQYFMSGSFGGVGNFIKQQPGLHAYQLVASGTDVKVIAYMPGCQIETLELIPEMPKTHALECRPSPPVTLTGKVNQRSLLVGKHAEVEASYLATWDHQFFGIADGAVSQFTVATATPDGDGVFTLSLPDFSRDPVSISWREKGEWQILLREVGTGNIIAWLQATDSERNHMHLPVRSSYPDIVLFNAVVY
jgi:hypothetical protein